MDSHLCLTETGSGWLIPAPQCLGPRLEDSRGGGRGHLEGNLLTSGSRRGLLAKAVAAVCNLNVYTWLLWVA